MKRAIHPGLALQDELTEYGITPTELARRIINGKRSITADTARRLGAWFGVEPQFWLNLQTNFELACVDQKMERAGIRLRLTFQYTIAHLEGESQ